MPGWLLNIGFTTLASYASYHTFVTRHVWDTPPLLFEGDALVRETVETSTERRIDKCKV